MQKHENSIIKHKENIFVRISKFLKKIFFKKDKTIKTEKEAFYNYQEKNDFIGSILLKEDEDEKKLKNLQIQYDNEEIEEDDISDEDIEKLVIMYEKETEELNKDTEIRKKYITQMLKELKNL